MRRLLFLSGIGFFFVLLSYLSFFAFTKQGEELVLSWLDFSQEDALFSMKRMNDTDDWKKIEKISDPEKYYYQKKLSPFDSIYFSTNLPNPITEKSGKDFTVLSIKKGTYLFNFTDVFQKYQIVSDNFKIDELGKGIFLVQNDDSGIRIYPFNSILKVTLLSSKKPVTAFTLFPSLLFSYNEAYNGELKNADILRIATIDSIGYVDFKKEDALKSILEANHYEDNASFVKASVADIEDKIKRYNDAYKVIMKKRGESVATSDLIEKYPFLFLNDSKKNMFLKGKLVNEFMAILSEDQYEQQTLKGREKNILTILDEMKSDEETYEEGLNLLKNYYYLSYFSGLFENRKNFDPSSENVFFQLFRTVLPDARDFGHYTYLSDSFLVYHFSDIDSLKLNDYIDRYLGSVIAKRTITKDDFLPFSFFLTEYLTKAMTVPDVHTLNIAGHLFSTTNEYYTILDTDEKKKKALPIMFYNYNRVFSKLNSSFLSSFFEESPDGLVLKEDYISDTGEPDFSADFFTAFKTTAYRFESELNVKRRAYSSRDSSSRWIHDSYTVLQNTYKQTEQILSTLTNYGEYLKNLKLNEENKRSSGILIINNLELKKEDLIDYLKKFNGVNINTLQIRNDFKKDGFYDAAVQIDTKIFTFKLSPEGHVVYDLVMRDSKWEENRRFQNFSISFDQKEKEWSEISNNAMDRSKLAAYDFRNIFLNVYLGMASDIQSPSTTTTTPTPTVIDTHPTMSPEMQLFVQNELIDKDFKNIASYLPIRFQNIYASIENREYRVDLFGIEKNIPANNRVYRAQISGKYIFSKHAFYKLFMRFTDEEKNPIFNGLSIEIAPSRIPLASLESTLKGLPRYLWSLSPLLKGNEKSIIFDFAEGVINIDGQKFTPKSQ